MKKRIHVMHLLLSLETGGCENGVVNLINNMDSGIFKVSVCCQHRIGEMFNRIHENRRHVHFIKKSGRTDLKDIYRLKNFFQEQKVDILHTHAFATLFSGYTGAKLAGVPIVVHGEHGIFYSDKFRRVIAQKILFRLVDCIITVSNDLSYRLSKTFKMKQNLFLPIINGVDISVFGGNGIDSRKRIRNEMSIPEDGCLIGSVGRLVDVKRYDLLIEWISDICLHENKVYLAIVGDGPLKDDLQRLINFKKMNHRIFLPGRKENVSEYLASFDVFTLTSKFEGISNTILEAMAAGLPIVASNVGGNSELVESNVNGFLFDFNDREQFSKLIRKIVVNPDLKRKMGICSREYVKNRFSLDRMVNNYEDVYLKLANKRLLIPS